MHRIGLGQDSHPFSKNNKPLILGGVKINDTNGLEGNSDADVILHSICNALSSAIGGDSIGAWADKLCLEQKICDSKVYLEAIFNKIKELKYQIENISISVEAKVPYLKIEEINLIKARLSELLEIKTDQIGITFTSGEGLTAFGQGEGVQALTIVLLKKDD